ncbi:4Fe-4S binding protein [Maridesulfovibrio sp.]|uniref:4Fe-4S binding protein n=1 Tax=Maridesulfovibrio sp. TaxID=2795000 RepID=UPI0039F012CF
MKKNFNFTDDFTEKYHGKLIPTKEAIKLLIAMMPGTWVSSGKDSPSAQRTFVLFESPCPDTEEKSPSLAEVCIFAERPSESFIAEKNLKNEREISEEEFVRILETKNAKGHVHYICFKKSSEGEFCAICNCCPGCCGPLKSGKSKVPLLVPSGYIAVVNPRKCIGCGQCMEYCPFGAMNLRNKRMRIDPERCMGCGVCTNKCRKDALRLARNKKHPEPFLTDKFKE